MSITYNNPRMYAEIPNWPMGGSKRGIAVFSIDTKSGKGERGTRVTRLDGQASSKPKVMTFARKARIVDGDDGRTYIVELSGYGFVSVMRSDMKLQQETVHERDPRHADMLKLFDQE